ncbi:MAG TPA: hypothetical protein VGY77_09365, partial [Gemmataceae bacterium]|nr:hypothetical protein [Gemmataceae bacterium]
KQDALSIVDGMVSGWHFYADWVKVLADERPGLIEIGNQRQEQLLALKATAETADRWIQQLEKVHAWLREIVEQERKKNDHITQQLESQRQQNYQLTQQVENQRLLNAQLVSQIRRWQIVEQSRGYRVLAFFQNRVMPRDTRRGRILRPGVNLAFHMLRPVYRGARMARRLLRPTAA